MNLRPLALGALLLAGAAAVANAQQIAPQQADDNDLGLTPAQMADFADRPNVVYATGPATPGLNSAPQPPWMGGQPGYPIPTGQPDFAGPQTQLMGYQAAPAGPLAPQQGAPTANPQQMMTPPPDAITPNWPNANIPQPMMPGSPPMEYGPSYGPGTPAGPGGDPYGGAYPSGLAPAAGSNPPRPAWYLRGDNVWLNRSRADDHNLTSYDNLNTASDPRNGHFLLDTNEVTYPLESGMRITLGRYLTDTWMIEGTYYGDVSWDRRNGTANFPTGANGLGPLLPYWGPNVGAFDTSAFTGANVMTAAYETQFNSFELNVRHSIWATTSIMAGFRYMNVGDLFQLTASDNANNSTPGAVGIYRTWTNNNLVGFQLGSEYAHDLWFPRLYGSVDWRGGVYANFAEQKNLLFNTGDTYDQRSVRDVPFATAWDITFTLSYLATDHLTIRGGYTFLFIDGIALAPDQLDTNPTTLSSRRIIADNDSLTLQGPFVGAELAW